MQTGKRVVVGIGEILWDLLPAGKQLGGAPANFVHHVREIGGGEIRPVMVSCIGDDALGREIIDRWRALGLEQGFLAVDSGHPTGTVAVSVDPEGRPVFRIDPESAWDHLPESPSLEGLAAAADAVCFGTLAQRAPRSRGTIRRFLRRVRPGTLRMYDVNLRAPFYSREVVEESLGLADAVKVNEEELDALAGYFSLPGGEAAAEGLLRRWPLRILAVTRGGHGSLLYSPGARSAHRGFPAEVADTVGAGDAFTAALVVGLLAGFPPDQLNECANRAASFVCTRPGGMPDMPQEIRRLFRRRGGSTAG
jgi:fructokinase